jgi:hypothetical protein
MATRKTKRLIWIAVILAAAYYFKDKLITLWSNATKPAVPPAV